MPYGSGPAPDKRTVNGFFCTGCNSLLISLYTHDYKECACGNMVDGGNDYVRRGYKDADAFAKVVEIYDFAPIFALAEIGGAVALGDEFVFGIETSAEFHEMLVGIDKYIDDERLILVSPASTPEEGDGIVGGMPDQAALEAEAAAKENEDQRKADELFAELSHYSGRRDE